MGHWKPVVDMQVLEEGMPGTVCPSPGTRPLLSNGWSGAGGVPQGHLHLGEGCEGQALPKCRELGQVGHAPAAFQAFFSFVSFWFFIHK